MNDVFKRKKDIVSRKIAGEHILVPIRGKLADMQRIFSVESVGEHIWKSLDGNRTLEEILTDVLNTFDVEREQAKTDLIAFVDELSSASLIVEVK